MNKIEKNKIKANNINFFLKYIISKQKLKYFYTIKLYIVKSEVYMNKKITKLNLIGLKCPFPVLKTMKKLKEIPNNQYLEVVTDDFNARKDFQELNNNGKILLIDLKKDNKNLFS